MSNTTVRSAACLATVAFVLPGAAFAGPLSLVGVFHDAALVVQVIILGLIVATGAAMVVCGMKLASGPRLAGASAYLSGLRLGGPLAGFVGAAYGGLAMSMGLANTTAPVPVNILAHGAAEIMMLILLGLVSGSVAVIANWAVEARIDRAVLSA